jgi:hypothetical protein
MECETDCEMTNRDIITIEVSTWCGHLGPLIMQLRDVACFQKVCPIQPVEIWPISPKEQPITPSKNLIDTR